MTEGNPAAPRIIGLIGGEGRMGVMFRRFFEADGYGVRVAGPSDDPGYDGLVAEADVIVVTVPILDTVGVVRRIAPLLRPEQLLSDFTSIKVEPVAAMLASSASVIGCHPLFGPMASPKGQNVVLCPARPGPWLPWYEDFLRRHGMKAVHLTPAEHDEAMAFIQGLTHFINIVFARTLQTHQAQLEQILQVCSPVYQVLFAILCRILAGDAHLYGQIQAANPDNPPVLEAFLSNGRAFLNVVEARDWDEVYRYFDEAAAYLGDYKQVAREESDFLIEQMTAYLARRRED